MLETVFELIQQYWPYVATTFVFILYFYPDIIHKFILFEGANDGLNYVHFAHIITDHIVNKQYLLAFMGGEKAYDLMPFYRYIWIINYL